jgi:hypothetical protein
MRRLHGQADRLLTPDLDFAAIDALIDDGGATRQAVAFAFTNDFLGPNRFGRMFPHAARFRPPAELLIELGAALQEADTEDPLEDPAGDSVIPAGFTYLGQFVDHDITFDPTIGFAPTQDPEGLLTSRTPFLDLDSLYGQGPETNPELYDPAFPPSEARFRVGMTTSVPDPPPDSPTASRIPALPNDLPRKGGGSKEAVIPDARNDENLIIAQLTVALLKLHNKLIESPPPLLEGESPFDAVRRLVRWHYQWIVLNDYLPRVLDPAVLADVLANGRRFYDFDQAPFNGMPFMPVEFSVAAYRMGHSMIRNSYNFNRVFSNDKCALRPGTLFRMFAFTGPGGLGAPQGGTDVPTLPSNWIIDWRRFFEVDDPSLLNYARKFDSKLAFALRRVLDVGPQEPVSLASRNLLRGRIVGLPTGQEVADIIEAKVLTPDEILVADPGPPARRFPEADIVEAHEFHTRTPLWFYILKEAEVQAQGQHLGEVGSRIIAEVFVGLLQGGPNSFLSAQPYWTPTLPAANPGTFTMADLLRFVGDINPIGAENQPCEE